MYAMRPHDLIVKDLTLLPEMLTACARAEWVVVDGEGWFGPYLTSEDALAVMRERIQAEMAAHA